VIFVDTSFFIALLSARDRQHARAVQALGAFESRRLHDELFTTNNVVLETITVAGRHGGHSLAVEAGEILYSENLARLYRTTAEDEASAFGYLKRHQDKRYSAVDCLSFVVMLNHGIEEAFAFDRRDFEHRFIVRPGPSG
jgi:predicted nucleic acid-binding protein